MQKEILSHLHKEEVDTSAAKKAIEKTTKFFIAADDILKTAREKKTDNKLENKFNKDGSIIQEFISEAYIDEMYNGESKKRPVIDLVQQGGGMYGIALLGYTYIMEKAGIRFYSYGGTSAGAINALFLAAISNNVYTKDSNFPVKDKSHQATKSEILTHIIANTDFSTFMEKDGVIGKIQEKLFKNFNSIGLKVLFGSFALTFLILIYAFFALIFNSSNGLSGTELRFFDFILGTLNVGALLIFVYILLVKILNVKFGINTGDIFYKWADNLLESLAITDTNDLTNRMNEVKLSPNGVASEPRLVLISSDLTHNRIVKFPERADDYWENKENIKPAAYLRATMSLPFIYKTFIPDMKHYAVPDPKNHVCLKARFVDGGMLSNFPIREFHRSDGLPPRFPTFGVLLSKRDMEPDEKKTTNGEPAATELKNITLVAYIMSFFKTFRNFYDNDFLSGNEEIERRVVTVNTKGYNWLDFWMDDSTKMKLFKEGAHAAVKQLEKFEWAHYKPLRTKK